MDTTEGWYREEIGHIRMMIWRKMGTKGNGEEKIGY